MNADPVIHAYSAGGQIVVLAAMNGTDGDQRELVADRLRTLLDGEAPPACVIVDTTIAAATDLAALAKDLEDSHDGSVKLTVVLPEFAPEDAGRFEEASRGISIQPTLPAALAACREWLQSAAARSSSRDASRGRSLRSRLPGFGGTDAGRR